MPLSFFTEKNYISPTQSTIYGYSWFVCVHDTLVVGGRASDWMVLLEIPAVCGEEKHKLEKGKGT